MTKLSMKKYGSVLTGRPCGAQMFAEISEEIGAIDGRIELDFSGVVSLGSSFGEEVIVPLARRQGDAIVVRAAIAPVKACIDMIAADFGLKVQFS